jgi:hypothetical protein
MKRSALDSLAERFPFRTHTSVCLRMRAVKVLLYYFTGSGSDEIYDVDSRFCFLLVRIRGGLIRILNAQL